MQMEKMIKTWQEGIAEFDENLRKRMDIIRHNEIPCEDLLVAELNWVKKVLGYVHHGSFPWWKSRQMAWQDRNSERINSYHRRYYSTPEHKRNHHAYYIKNKERRKDYYKNYRKTHKKQIEAYRLLHKEELKEYYRLRYQRQKLEKKLKPRNKEWQHEYYLRNKEKRKAYYDLRYREHPEKIANWNLKNHDRILAQKRERYARKKAKNES